MSLRSFRTEFLRHISIVDLPRIRLPGGFVHRERRGTRQRAVVLRSWPLDPRTRRGVPLDRIVLAIGTDRAILVTRHFTIDWCVSPETTGTRRVHKRAGIHRIFDLNQICENQRGIEQYTLYCIFGILFSFFFFFFLFRQNTNVSNISCQFRTQKAGRISYCLTSFSDS